MWNAYEPWTYDVSILAHSVNEKSWENVDAMDIYLLVEATPHKYYLVYCNA